jgi:hypothetical protein
MLSSWKFSSQFPLDRFPSHDFSDRSSETARRTRRNQLKNHKFAPGILILKPNAQSHFHLASLPSDVYDKLDKEIKITFSDFTLKEDLTPQSTEIQMCVNPSKTLIEEISTFV